MASPNLLAGNKFRLYKSAGGTPETFTFVCLAQTIALTRTNQFEDATVPDCATPTSVPWRKSVLRAKEWSLRFSGAMDAALISTVEGDVDSETAVRYQILQDLTGANGGATYTGAIFIESFEKGKTNNGIVTFTATCRGDDSLVKTPNA